MVEKVSTGQGLAGRRAKVTPPPAQPRIALLPNDDRFGLCPTCGHMIDRCGEVPKVGNASDEAAVAFAIDHCPVPNSVHVSLR
jgi:hypothetical protein